MPSYSNKEERSDFIQFLINLNVDRFVNIIQDSYQYSLVETMENSEKIYLAIDKCELALESDNIEYSLSNITKHIDIIFSYFSNLLGYHIVSMQTVECRKLKNKIEEQSNVIDDLLHIQRAREREHAKQQAELNKIIEELQETKQYKDIVYYKSLKVKQLARVLDPEGLEFNKLKFVLQLQDLEKKYKKRKLENEAILYDLGTEINDCIDNGLHARCVRLNNRFNKLTNIQVELAEDYKEDDEDIMKEINRIQLFQAKKIAEYTDMYYD